MEERNKWGRPLKFESIEELEILEDWKVQFEWKKFFNKDFKKEKDLVLYIADNIDLFCKDWLNDECIWFEIDSPINKYQRFWPRWKRIDLLIKWKEKLYIIECKNAENTTEMRYSIWQLLDYWREYLDTNKKELILIANMFDKDTAETISYYNLPIRYLVISKKQILEYVWKQ